MKDRTDWFCTAAIIISILSILVNLLSNQRFVQFLGDLIVLLSQGIVSK